LKKSVEKCAVGRLACQEVILRYFKANGVAVNVFLKSGIKIQGIILAFDAGVVTLRNAYLDQMIFKHAISTIEAQSKQTKESLSGVDRNRLDDGTEI